MLEKAKTLLFTGMPPEAVNLWIGDSRSVTSIHSGKSLLNFNLGWSNVCYRSLREHLFRNQGLENVHSFSSDGRLVYGRYVGHDFINQHERG